MGRALILRSPSATSPVPVRPVAATGTGLPARFASPQPSGYGAASKREALWDLRERHLPRNRRGVAARQPAQAVAALRQIPDCRGGGGAGDCRADRRLARVPGLAAPGASSALFGGA